MIAYLIVAHTQPKLVGDLLEALRSPVSAAFVHIDRKSNIARFEHLAGPDTVLIREREKVYWGGWSQVQATLNLLRSSLSDPRPFTHFALLSGMDYPLVRSEELLSYLSQVDMEFINCLPMPSKEANKPIRRLLVRHIEGGARQSGLRAKLVKLANLFLAALPSRNLARALGGVQPFCGSNWWILSRDMALAAIAETDRARRLRDFFRTTHCPDESYFQTIVRSSLPIEKIGRAFTYTDWSVPNPPAIIDDRHVDLITAPGFRLDDFYGAGPCLFVRKVPVDRPDLLRRLDDFARKRRLDPVADRPEGGMNRARRPLQNRQDP